MCQTPILFFKIYLTNNKCLENNNSLRNKQPINLVVYIKPWKANEKQHTKYQDGKCGRTIQTSLLQGVHCSYLFWTEWGICGFLLKDFFVLALRDFTQHAKPRQLKVKVCGEMFRLSHSPLFESRACRPGDRVRCWRTSSSEHNEPLGLSSRGTRLQSHLHDAEKRHI